MHHTAAFGLSAPLPSYALGRGVPFCTEILYQRANERFALVVNPCPARVSDGIRTRDVLSHSQVL